MIKNLIIKNLEECYKDIAKISKNTQIQIVSKQQNTENIETIIKQGHLLFGENKIQEAKLKWPYLQEKYSNLKLHFIGSLQKNKVKDVVNIFDAVESLDRYSLAEKLDLYEKQMNRKLKYYIQVNSGAEKQKGGVSPEECINLYKLCKKNLDLNIVGLMCIPPINEEPSLHFALISNLAKELGLKEMSMGMSSDFKIAIEFGSTQVRIGQKIFGPRSKS